MRVFKYASPLIIYYGSWHSFSVIGWQVWLPLVFAWIAIPFIELLIKPDPANMEVTEEDLAKKNRVYDILLYGIVLLQYTLLIKFLYAMSHDKLAWYDIAGRIWVMGLLCGIFGINVGHELGHRVNIFEQAMAKMLLLTSQYMHFFIEHNKGE